MKTSQIHLAYIWELPVRLFHWVNVLCLVVLAITGYIIGNPPALMSSAEAYSGYWFGWVRFIHFATAYLFLLNAVIRLYWAFVGNSHSRWSSYLPLSAGQRSELGAMVKRYGLLELEEEQPSGHNALAGLSYFVLMLVVIFQLISGFGMYAAMSDSWFPQMFSWIVPLMGGDMAVRQWHHLVMWVLILFGVIHVYLVVFNEYLQPHGLFLSIITGWKFVRRTRSGNNSN